MYFIIVISVNYFVQIILQVRKEYERKLYDLQADIKSNEFDKTDVENKTEEKNYLLKL